MSSKYLEESTSLFLNPVKFNCYRLLELRSIAERVTKNVHTEGALIIKNAALAVSATPTFGSLLDLQRTIADFADEIDNIEELRDYVDGEIAVVRHRFSEGNHGSLFAIFFIGLQCQGRLESIWYPGEPPFLCGSSMFTVFLILLLYAIIMGIGRWITEGMIRSHTNIEHKLAFDGTFFNDLAVGLVFFLPTFFAVASLMKPY